MILIPPHLAVVLPCIILVLGRNHVNIAAIVWSHHFREKDWGKSQYPLKPLSRNDLNHSLHLTGKSSHLATANFKGHKIVSTDLKETHRYLWNSINNYWKVHTQSEDGTVPYGCMISTKKVWSLLRFIILGSYLFFHWKLIFLYSSICALSHSRKLV